MDTGAAVSLISEKMYKNLPFQCKLCKTDIPALQAANGNSLVALGWVDISFKIAGLTLKQIFYVTRGLNGNMILGRHWLTNSHVRLYFDLGLMRIDGKSYAELKEDVHISSIVRVAKKLVNNQNTVTIFQGSVSGNFPLEDCGVVELNNIDNNCVLEYFGLYLKESVCSVGKDERVSLILVNQTNKTYKIPRRCIVGRMEVLKPQEISNIYIEQDPREKIDVPKRFENDIQKLIKENNDLFARKDNDLRVTNTVNMRIDTGYHCPIN